MEAHNARDSHAGALEVRHTASDPVRPHANGGESVHASFGAEIVDLGGRGVEFEEGVVDCGRDGLGEGVGWSRGIFEGGDGRGDDGGPFGVSVTGCWRHGCCYCCCCFGVSCFFFFGRLVWSSVCWFEVARSVDLYECFSSSHRSDGKQGDLVNV
jgi:hypothetical protein